MKAAIEKLLKQYYSKNLDDIIDYERFNHYSIVHHSTTIEGSTLTDIETRLLLEENLTPKGKPLEHSLMTRDHFQALQFVLDTATRKEPVSSAFIRAVNAHVMKGTGAIYQTVLGTIDASQGMYRKGNVRAGDSYFVNYDKVEYLVEELVLAINKQLAGSSAITDILEVSFMAHFHLVSIHPFYDGNGRTSRLLMNYIQRVADLPMAIVYKEDKADYFTALEESRQQEDASIFKYFMYTQYERYLKEEMEKYDKLTGANKKKRNIGGNDFTFFF